MKNDVVIQRGHNVTYGGNVTQNIRITGARVVEIGAATECGAYSCRPRSMTIPLPRFTSSRTIRCKAA